MLKGNADVPLLKLKNGSKNTFPGKYYASFVYFSQSLIDAVLCLSYSFPKMFSLVRMI